MENEEINETASAELQTEVDDFKIEIVKVDTETVLLQPKAY